MCPRGWGRQTRHLKQTSGNPDLGQEEPLTEQTTEGGSRSSSHIYGGAGRSQEETRVTIPLCLLYLLSTCCDRTLGRLRGQDSERHKTKPVPVVTKLRSGRDPEFTRREVPGFWFWEGSMGKLYKPQFLWGRKMPLGVRKLEHTGNICSHFQRFGTVKIPGKACQLPATSPVPPPTHLATSEARALLPPTALPLAPT